MEMRLFGKTGVKVAAIGQGTWHMEDDERSQAIASLRRGLDLGMNHIDTAELYGAGAVEELVGEALAGRRQEAFLASKVLPDNASRTGTVRACERSLRRLRTDHLDLYLLHWPGEHPLEDTLAAFEELVRTGKIRFYGVANFDVRLLEAVVGLARPGPVACDQVLYHLEERDIEHAVIPRCQQLGAAVVAYSPFGSGHFPSARSPGGRVLAEIAARHRATPRQVALRFLLRHPGSFAIPKSSRPAHVAENAGAADLVLTPEDIALIDRVFPRKPPRPTLPVL